MGGREREGIGDREGRRGAEGRAGQREGRRRGGCRIPIVFVLNHGRVYWRHEADFVAARGVAADPVDP